MSNANGKAPKITVNVQGWKMREVMAYFEAARGADVRGLIALFAAHVKSWPFEGKPDDVAAYGDLTPGEYAQVRDAFADAVQDLFQE